MGAQGCPGLTVKSILVRDCRRLCAFVGVTINDLLKLVQSLVDKGKARKMKRRRDKKGKEGKEREREGQEGKGRQRKAKQKTGKEKIGKRREQ